MALAEVEVRWDLTPRWSLIGFTGAGKAVEEIEIFSSSKLRAMGGGGFGYLVARLLNMRAGLDIARGSEEWTYYVMVGHT